MSSTQDTASSIAADWACAVINRNLLKAEGLDGQFEVVEPKNRFDLDQTIAAAVSRKEPILFYYWQPNATLAQFSFKPVDLGPFSKDDFACLGKRNCADPKPSSFAPEPVVTALAEWVFTGAPDVALIQANAAKMKKYADALPTWFPSGSGPEAGVKTAAKPEIWSRSADFAAAAKKYQTEAAKLAAVAATRDVDAIRARGLEATAHLARGAWSLDGSLAWTDAKVRASGVAAGLDGLRPAQVPRLAASATLAWRPRAGRELALTVRHAGAQYEDDLQTDVLPAATTLIVATPARNRRAGRCRRPERAAARLWKVPMVLLDQV